MRYILGDAMDRGPEPIRVFRDIMNRPKVIYILGNHDVRFFLLMKKLLVEVTEENAEIQLIQNFYVSIMIGWKMSEILRYSSFVRCQWQSRRI